jgi:hypothetical protein
MSGWKKTTGPTQHFGRLHALYGREVRGNALERSSIMGQLLRLVRAVGRRLVTLFVLIRDGDEDLHGTYPEQYVPTGEQVATQGSVCFNLLGIAH